MKIKFSLILYKNTNLSIYTHTFIYAGMYVLVFLCLFHFITKNICILYYIMHGSDYIYTKAE